MPKRIVELLGPESLPQRQPHAAIVDLLRSNQASQAFTCDEIIDAVRSQVPSWRFAGDLPVTQRVAVTAALHDLLGTGLIVELTDGAEMYYGMPPRAAER